MGECGENVQLLLLCCCSLTSFDRRFICRAPPVVGLPLQAVYARVQKSDVFLHGFRRMPNAVTDWAVNFPFIKIRFTSAPMLSDLTTTAASLAFGLAPVLLTSGWLGGCQIKRNVRLIVFMIENSGIVISWVAQQGKVFRGNKRYR